MSDAEARPDPYRRHRFVVEADGLPKLGIAEVRGLEVTVEARPDRTTDASAASEGSDDRPWWDVGGVVDRVVDRNRPGRPGSTSATPVHDTTSPNLELRRGVTDEPALWNWLRDWVDGRIGPRTVRVYLLDGTGSAAVGWACAAATPVEWTGPDLRADAAGVATERLELAHEGISDAVERRE